MSLIVAEVYDALIEAGTSEEKAKAAAGAIPLADRLATKEDLDELKAADQRGLGRVESGDQRGLGRVESGDQRGLGRVESQL